MLKVGYLSDKNYDKYCTADAVLSYKFAQSLSIIPTPPLAGVKVPRQIRTGGIGNGIVNSAISYAQLTGENTQKMVDQFIAEQRTALRLAQPARQILPLAIRNNPNNLLAITYEPTQEDNQFAPGSRSTTTLFVELIFNQLLVIWNSCNVKRINCPCCATIGVKPNGKFTISPLLSFDKFLPVSKNKLYVSTT